MSTTEVQDSFLELTLKDLDKNDPDYALMKKILDKIHVSLKNPGVDGVGIFRESFNDVFSGGYYVSESGSGIFQNMVKIVEGVPVPIRPALIGEIALIRGSGATELVAPQGWRIIADTLVQSRYNIGTSPNWEVAAIEYIGV